MPDPTLNTPRHAERNRSVTILREVGVYLVLLLQGHDQNIQQMAINHLRGRARGFIPPSAALRGLTTHAVTQKYTFPESLPFLPDQAGFGT